MTIEKIKEVGKELGAFILVGCLLFLCFWALGWIFNSISESAEQNRQAKEAQYASNRTQVLSFDEQLEAKKKCAEAGLTVDEDKIQVGEYDWAVSGVQCGKPIAQVEAENLDPGMTTGEGVAAGAALGAGAYIIGKLIE